MVHFVLWDCAENDERLQEATYIWILKTVRKSLLFNTGLSDSVPYWTDKRGVYSTGRHAILIDVTPQRKVSSSLHIDYTDSIWADRRRQADIAFVICYPGCHNKQNLTHTHTYKKKKNKRKDFICSLLMQWQFRPGANGWRWSGMHEPRDRRLVSSAPTGRWK